MMKKTLLEFFAVLGLGIIGFIGMMILFFIMSKCEAQSIHLTSSYLTNQKLSLDIYYSGQSTSVGSVSMQIEYDSSVYIYDSTVRQNDYLTTGMYIATSSANAQTWFGISWFASSFTYTVFTNNKPMFTCYFTAKKEQCANFHWRTPPTDNCQIADIDGIPIQNIYWQDTTICNLTTGIGEYQNTVNSDTKIYNLLLQEVSIPKGWYIQNRKLKYRQ